MMYCNEIFSEKYKSIGFMHSYKYNMSVGYVHEYMYEKDDIKYILSVHVDHTDLVSVYDLRSSNTYGSTSYHFVDIPNTDLGIKTIDSYMSELFSTEIRDNELNKILE